METESTKKVPYVTICFIAANILIWLVLEIMGKTQDSEFMLSHGAAYRPYIIQGGQYYRLFTCMFLHFGADHLMNNMLVLGLTGMRLEAVTGSIRFGMLYLFSGLCGSVLSLYDKTEVMNPAVSAGASGCVFGVIGGLLAWAVFHKGRVGTLTAKGLMGMAALSLYFGFTTAGVDNWGHIGGLLGGFLLGGIYAAGSKIRNSKRNHI